MFVRQGPNTVDASLSVTTNFGAVTTATASNALNLGQAVNVTPHFEMEVNVPALPGLVAGESVSFQFQDSADGVTFANLPATFTVPGVANTGALATSLRIGLASTTRQYVQLVATVAAGGPNLTASSFEFHPVFWSI